MKSFLLFLTAFFTSNFKERRDLALENLALRQQLAVLKRERKRPAIKNRDRGLFSGRTEMTVFKLTN